MGFFKQELEGSPGISKNYFRSRAEAVLSELSSVNFELVSLDAARFYSLVFAEAKEANATQRRDLAVAKRKMEYWLTEQDRWHKAILQARGGDLSLLSQELDQEADIYFRRRYESDEMVYYGVILSNLSEILSPTELTL